MKLHPFLTFNGRYAFALHALQGKPVRLLDVGNLGDGTSMNLCLKEEVERLGGTYVGLDSNEELTRSLKLPHQVVGDLHDAPFPPETFDVVYAGEIIEHTWTPARMVQECWRILKPAGRLVLDTPNPYSVASVLRYFLKRCDSMGDVRSLVYREAHDRFASMKQAGATLHQPQHKIFFTPAMMKQLLEMHSFRLVGIGCTVKPRNLLHRVLLWFFPHGGNHLCVIAEKSTLEEIYSDILSSVPRP